MPYFRTMFAVHSPWIYQKMSVFLMYSEGVWKGNICLKLVTDDLLHFQVFLIFIRNRYKKSLQHLMTICSTLLKIYNNQNDHLLLLIIIIIIIIIIIEIKKINNNNNDNWWIYQTTFFKRPVSIILWSFSS